MRNNQPPYRSPSLNERFRAAVKGSDAPSIRRVAVVGGLFDKHYNFNPDDDVTVRRSLQVLERAGIGISSEVEFDFYNLLAPVRSDFLRAAWTADPRPQNDLVIVCGIWGGASSMETIEMHPRHEQEEPYEDLSYQSRCRDHREVAISFIQCSPEGWPYAAHFSGTKIAVTRGDDGIDCVNNEHFMFLDKYKTAIATKEKFEPISGWISGSLGVVVHKDAVAELKKTANKQDLLGRRILAL